MSVGCKWLKRGLNLNWFRVGSWGFKGLESYLEWVDGLFRVGLVEVPGGACKGWMDGLRVGAGLPHVGPRFSWAWGLAGVGSALGWLGVGLGRLV